MYLIGIWYRILVEWNIKICFTLYVFKGAVQSVKLLIATSVAATKMIDYCNIIENIEKTLFPLQNIEKKTLWEQPFMKLMMDIYLKIL